MYYLSGNQKSWSLKSESQLSSERSGAEGSGSGALEASQSAWLLERPEIRESLSHLLTVKHAMESQPDISGRARPAGVPYGPGDINSGLPGCTLTARNFE